MKNIYKVDGMSCVICKNTVEKTLNKMAGINSCQVNLMENEVNIDFDEKLVTPLDMEKALKEAGYKLIINSNKKKHPNLKLFIAIFFEILLIINSILFEEYRYSQLLIAIILYLLDGEYFIFGFKALFKLKPNMDSLVALSSSVSFIYSLYALITNKGNLYFETGAMILLIVTIGKKIEGTSKKKATKVIRGLSSLIPMNANKLVEDEVVVIKNEDIKKGDILLVKAGESLPTDGIVVEGISYVDESLITGESLPLLKQKDDEVIGGTINLEGSLKIKVTKNNAQTFLSNVISLTKQASLSKVHIQRFADKVSNYFVFVILGISLITFIVWSIVSKDLELAMNFSLSVLVISCPCALGLATPSALTVASGQASKNGLLIRNPEVLEVMPLIKTAVLDKTGTLTDNKLSIVKVKEYNPQFINILTSLEINSNHSLAKSIIKKYGEGSLELMTKEVIGKGIISKDYFAGNKKLLSDLKIEVPEEIEDYSNKNNYSYICAGYKKEIYGVLYYADVLKDSSKKAIKGFKERGIKPIIASGDSFMATENVAKKLNIKDYLYGALPSDKNQLVIDNKKDGKVMMVGDGINDTISLSNADVSFTLNNGVDIAHASSDVILIHNDLNDINYFIDLSKKTILIIKENLFWALFYNSLFIPVAAGVLYKPLGIALTPIMGSITMAISSIIVLSNALRIRKVKKENQHE